MSGGFWDDPALDEEPLVSEGEVDDVVAMLSKGGIVKEVPVEDAP